jgi:hypothetical protein
LVEHFTQIRHSTAVWGSDGAAGTCGRALERMKGPRYSLLVPARRSALHAAALALALALAALTVTGCGNGAGADPQPLPPITQSPTASPSPPVTKDDLQQSAEQFIRAYYRALVRANATADPTVLQRDYYDDTCRPCQFDIRALNKLRNQGQHIEGYDVVLDEVAAGELAGNTIAVTVVLRAKAGRVVDESGKTVRMLSARGPLKTDLIVAQRGEGWRIVEVVPLGAVK